MVHVPAKFRENTSMCFWVTVRKLNVTDGRTDRQTDRQTDGRTHGGRCNISRPGPSAPREIIKQFKCNEIIWMIYNGSLYPRNLKFRGYYGFGPEPSPPPHAKACVSRNCDTNAHIKFIIDTAIDDLEWKNPIDFGANRKNQNGHQRPFCENMINKRPPGLIAPLLRFWHLLGNPPKNTTKGKICYLMKASGC